MTNSRIDQLTEATELTPADLLLLEQNSTAKKMTWNTFLGKTHAALTGQSGILRVTKRNLLDNSDFTNPVAQAGIGKKHGEIAYAADRWILNSGTVSYNAGVGLTLNGTIRQKLEFPPTGATSAFVGMASGTASISYADGAVTITSSGGVLKWAALYQGSYTAETMPEYQPKGYGAELAECQRYYNRIVSAWANQNVCVLTINPGKTIGWGLIPLSQKMRKSPSLMAVGSFKCFSGASWTSYQPSEITIRGAAPDTEYFFIQVSLPAELTGGVGAFLQFADDQSYLEFIADL